jgi:hypothetical protein
MRYALKITCYFLSLLLLCSCGGSDDSATTNSGTSSILARFADTVLIGSDNSSFSSVAVAGDGSVYAAGLITGTGIYNFGNFVAAIGTFSGQNIILVKYNASGVAQWAQTTLLGPSASSFSSVAVAPDGSIYAAGIISGTGVYNFGNAVTAIGTFSGQNIILVKYNANGLAQWAKTVTLGPDVSSFSSIAVADDGSVYAAGLITGTGIYNFGNTITATGTFSGQNIILVKYNASGTTLWAQTIIAGINASNLSSVAVATDGSVYVSGIISGTGLYNFGKAVTAAGTFSGQNIILVKYNSSGLAQWAKTVTLGPDNSSFSSVAVAGDGSVYAAGLITGTGLYNFGNAVTATGTFSGQNILLAKYDPTGATLWAKTMITGTNVSNLSALAVAIDGSVYVAGYITGSSLFDLGNNVRVTGIFIGQNILLAKYNSSGIAQLARTIVVGPGISSFSSLDLAADGSVYATGIISGTGTYSFGNSISAFGTFSGQNICLVKYL